MTTSTKIVILVLAIILMYNLARRFRLGHVSPIVNANDAIRIAAENMPGFEGTEAIVDRSGGSALVRGSAENYAYIRKHGAHYVVRRICGTAIVQCDDNQIVLRHQDLPSGAAILKFSHNAETWLAHTAIDKN
jgi:hypothetical protein